MELPERRLITAMNVNEWLDALTATPCYGSGKSLPGLAGFALPAGKSDFTPNVSDIRGLIYSFGVPATRILRLCGGNYSKFKKRYSLWASRRDKVELAMLTGEEVHHSTVISLTAQATSVLSYEDWLVILREAGVLSSGVIHAVLCPEKQRRLSLMQRDSVSARIRPVAKISSGLASSYRSVSSRVTGPAIAMVGAEWLSCRYDSLRIGETFHAFPDDIKDDTVFIGCTFAGCSLPALAKGLTFVKCSFEKVHLSGVILANNFVSAEVNPKDFYEANQPFTCNSWGFSRCVGTLHLSKIVMTGCYWTHCGNMALSGEGVTFSGCVFSGEWLPFYVTDFVPNDGPEQIPFRRTLLSRPSFTASTSFSGTGGLEVPFDTAMWSELLARQVAACFESHISPEVLLTYLSSGRTLAEIQAALLAGEATPVDTATHSAIK